MRTTDVGSPVVEDSPSIGEPTVCAAFQRVVEHYPDKLALRSREGAGPTLTWAELGDRVRTLTGGLHALGLRRGDALAMLLPNIAECHLIDFAAIHLGVLPFTVYNTSSPQQIVELIENSGAKTFVTSPDFLEQAAKVRELTDQLEHVVLVGPEDPEGPATTTLTAVEALEHADDFDFDAQWQAIEPDDLVSLIYTSGTTGPPKGVLWSHKTVLAQQRSLAAAMPMARECVISFLPLAHAGGRITSHYQALLYGATITCCPVVNDFASFLGEYHPDTLLSPPRIWEKLQVGIENMVHRLPDEEREEVQAAIERGVQQALDHEMPDEPPAAIAPIIERIGLDRVRTGIVGGAPSAPHLSAFFRAVGVPMLEAYGGTETGMCVFNRIEDFKGGTAGKPLPGVEMKLLDDGEVLIRSDMTMVGYRGQEERTKETIDEEGWLHSGDIGEVDDDGFLKIVDRKSEIIISAAAKNMSPANIEQAIKSESSLIGQIVCIGDGRRYNTALITVDPDAAASLAEREALGTTDHAEIAASDVVRAKLQEAVDKGNEKLSRVETIKKFEVLHDVWMPDGEILTPTAKVKRRKVDEVYSDQIEALYAE